MKKIKVEREIIVGTGSEVAEVLGLEPRRFQQMVKQGHIEGKISHNQYDLSRCFSTYQGYLQTVRR